MKWQQWHRPSILGAPVPGTSSYLFISAFPNSTGRGHLKDGLCCFILKVIVAKSIEWPEKLYFNPLPIPQYHTVLKILNYVEWAGLDRFVYLPRHVPLQLKHYLQHIIMIG